MGSEMCIRDSPWALPELLDREKEVVGIYISAHPLDGFRFEMENYNITGVSELEASRGRTIRIAGYVTDALHMTTKKGSKFGKFVLNDYSGNTEIVLWEKNYVAYGNYLVNGQKLMIQGSYEEHKYRPGVMEFNIQNVMLLDQVRKSLSRKLHLELQLFRIDPDFVEFMNDNLKKNPGTTELVLKVVDEVEKMAIGLKTQKARIEINDELIQYLQLHDEIKYKLETV